MIKTLKTFSIVAVMFFVTFAGGCNLSKPLFGTAVPTVQPTLIRIMPATQPPVVQSSALAPFFPADDATHGRFANDALLPTNLSVSRCPRPWQALMPDRNGSKNANWTALICDPQAAHPETTAFFFTQPWNIFIIAAKGEVKFVVIRDLRAIEQLKARNEWDGKDPYDKSVAGDWSKQSKTLSIYFEGSGSILDSKSVWQPMVQSFYQVPFGKDFADGWVFDFDFGQGGSANIWIGSTEYVAGSTTTLHSLFDLPKVMAK